MKKKFWSYMFNFLLVSTLSFMSCCNAQESEVINYVALGDSIASGYVPGKINLDKDCYAYLLKSDMEKCENKSICYENIAVSGQPTQSLMLQLQNLDLSNADIITISIGSNDILIPFKNLILTSLGCVSGNSIDEVANLFSQVQKNGLYAKYRLSRLMNILSNVSNNDVIKESANDIKTNIDSIIKTIRGKNTKAKIILTNFYNPYECIEIEYAKGFIESFNNIKQELNEYLRENARENKYYIADISDLGKDENLLNINLKGENISFDPHPNKEGHQKIYQAIKKTKFNK